MPCSIARRVSFDPTSIERLVHERVGSVRGGGSLNEMNKPADALSERSLIERFFRDCGARRPDVAVGVGDDAALLDMPAGVQLVAKTDTLVSGIHFLPHFPAESIGHRALAVNLSDMAAMGATPAWALLALTLPKADASWLAAFAEGFGTLARKHNVALVGGDTTSGPLCITVQVLGYVQRPAVMLRSGGKPGDVLFVSGTPGDAGAGLELEQGKSPQATPVAAYYLRQRFLFPTPRVELGQKLREHASACIDVSDGLLGDAGKLAAASHCGVVINYEQIPISPHLLSTCGDTRGRELALTGGDDYELCFSVPVNKVARMTRDLSPTQWSYRPIGVLRAEPGSVVMSNGTVMDFSHSGFDHFAR
jgi:thiamine-monophosphate kinase